LAFAHHLRALAATERRLHRSAAGKRGIMPATPAVTGRIAALVSRAPGHDPLVGTTLLGRYRIQAKLGEGGTSVVYRGVHVSLDRTVAIKVMRAEILQVEGMAARLLQEGKAACRIRNEHVADVTDFGVTHDGQMVLVMEYLEGETLDRLVDREGALPWVRARAIALQICAAVRAAHDAGVIHRDLTLGNCFRLTRNGNRDYIKVIDFGIARAIGGHAARPVLPRLTGRTEIFGTPEFMAPEQARSAWLADARSDVYAVGVQLYALVTGRLPLQAGTPVDTLAMQLRDEPVPPSQLVRSLPRELDRVLLRALAKDPEERYQSVAELAAALESIGTLIEVPPPPQWRGRSRPTAEEERLEQDDADEGELVSMTDAVMLDEPELARPRWGRRLAMVVAAAVVMVGASVASGLTVPVARTQVGVAWDAVQTTASTLAALREAPPVARSLPSTDDPAIAVPASPVAIFVAAPHERARKARIVVPDPPPPPPSLEREPPRPQPRKRPKRITARPLAPRPPAASAPAEPPPASEAVVLPTVADASTPTPEGGDGPRTSELVAEQPAR
jgi:serine/threonine-protein kinase